METADAILRADPRETEPDGIASPNPHVLFLPVTGDHGMGEYARCVLLASGIRQRWPAARIRFLVSYGTPRFEEDQFERLWVRGSPTFNTRVVNEVLRADPPDVAVFDNSGRTTQLRFARSLGVRTVFLSSRPTTRRKGFRLRRLRNLDQFWILRSGPERAAPGIWQRLLVRVAGGPEVILLDTLLPDPDPERRLELRQRLGIPPGPFALFAPGGGQWSLGGRPAGDLFAVAARRVVEDSGFPCVVVLGNTSSEAPCGVRGLVTLRIVNPSHLAALLQDAHLAVIGGGSIVGQALAQGKVCVAIPAGGSDQRSRVRRYCREGLLQSADADVEAIGCEVIRLLKDSVRYHAIRRRVDLLGLKNGLATAMDSLERLLVPPAIARTGPG